MADFAKEITPVTIEGELQQSYLDYAMSVIVGRALPDVRDGLKPVHRRVLFAMHTLNNDANKPYKKSARIVGDVIGKYHPHGDVAVYDAIVRMAQPFSLRYLLVDGQGNFGSVDGDSAAAMRYTEIRLTHLAHALMADLDKETVDFQPNYDETEWMPSVMPTRVPNLLVNGSSGIAVGMATNIPPHNLTEVVNACLALIEDDQLSIDELLMHVPGPDFPTAAIINGRAGIVAAYRTGRGRVKVRARTDIETASNGKQTIVVHELPYQVNKARLLEKIGELVREKRVEGITALRDESDKDGMRMVIEVRRGDNAEIILNQLYSQTQLQTVFGINMVALDQGQPKVMNLKEVLLAFIQHRREIVTRRSIYELRKARERAHLLEGLGIALVNIDEVVRLIRGSKTAQEAKTKLLAARWVLGSIETLLSDSDGSVSRPQDLSIEFGVTSAGYRLSPAQAQAILDLRLHRLTGLEYDKILEEYKNLLMLIKELLTILSDPERLMTVIREDLLEVKTQFGDARRTEILESQEDLTDIDLVPDETVVVTLSHEGYLKTQKLEDYQAQHRGGKGKSATRMKEEDIVSHVLVANTHDTILCFSNRGKVYWLQVYQLPQASRSAMGRPIVNLFPLDKGERINAMLPLREYGGDHFVVLATAKGVVKKMALDQFSRPRPSGIIAIGLDEDDVLIGANLTTGTQDLMLFSNAGKVVRFSETGVRATGRTSRGVRGMKVGVDQKIISLIVANAQDAILTVTQNGYGKRTALEAYRTSARGAQGVISIQVTERNGEVIAAVQVRAEDDVILMTNGGTLVRTPVQEISLIGRNTQGVRLIRLSQGEKLNGLECIKEIGGKQDDSASS